MLKQGIIGCNRDDPDKQKRKLLLKEHQQCHLSYQYIKHNQLVILIFACTSQILLTDHEVRKHTIMHIYEVKTC